MIKGGLHFTRIIEKKIEGEVTYGDTSMSLEFVRDNFVGLEIAGVEFNEADPLQLIVFLTKSTK